MARFNSTPLYLYANRCVEVTCWTCQKPILRSVYNVKKVQRKTGIHYCSQDCWTKAAHWRRIARIWSSIRLEGDCWIWQGSLNKAGYGTVRVDPRDLLVHRYVYELVRGPIPSQLELDHLCRRHACMNPAHLEAVTGAVNKSRSPFRNTTHCRRGHLYTPETTRITKEGWRACRLCKRYYRERYAKG